MQLHRVNIRSCDVLVIDLDGQLPVTAVVQLHKYRRCVRRRNIVEHFHGTQQCSHCRVMLHINTREPESKKTNFYSTAKF